jgi:capsular polysaccharide transport system permease protein
MSEHIKSSFSDAAMALLFDGELEKAKALIDGPASDLSAKHSDQLRFLYHERTGNRAAALYVLLNSFDRGEGFCPNISSLPWVFDALSKERFFRRGLQLAQMARANGYINWETAAQEIRFLSLGRKLDEAQALLQEIWPAIPAARQDDFGVLQARIFLLLGQGKQALGKFFQNLQRPKGTRALYIRAARLALGLGELGHAHRFMNLSVQIFGGTTQDYLMMADILTKSGNSHAVVGYANQALTALNNSDVVQTDAVRRCYEFLVNAHLALNQFNLALNQLLESVEEDPAWLQGKVLIVTCCLELKYKEKAEQVLAELVQQAPTDPDVLAAQHRFHVAFGDGDAAASALHALTTHHGDHDHAKSAQALALSRSDERFLEELSALEMAAIFAPQWDHTDLVAWGSARHGLSGHLRSVTALLLRESRTRFVRHKLGILWAFLEPAVHTALFVLIFVVIGMESVYGMSIPLFIITGIIPYQCFASAFGQANTAVTGNKDLFMHPRVQVFDVIVARSVLEAIVATVVFGGFLLGLGFWEYSLYTSEILMVLLGFFGLLCCGVGLGLLTASVKIVLPGVATIIQHSTRILFFTSGVFFAPEMFSSELRDIMLLNPLLHYISMIRSSFSPVLGHENIYFMYAFVWGLGMLTLGFVFERAFRFRLLSQ